MKRTYNNKVMIVGNSQLTTRRVSQSAQSWVTDEALIKVTFKCFLSAQGYWLYSDAQTFGMCGTVLYICNVCNLKVPNIYTVIIMCIWLEIVESFWRNSYCSNTWSCLESGCTVQFISVIGFLEAVGTLAWQLIFVVAPLFVYAIRKPRRWLHFNWLVMHESFESDCYMTL